MQVKAGKQTKEVRQSQKKREKVNIFSY